MNGTKCFPFCYGACFLSAVTAHSLDPSVAIKVRNCVFTHRFADRQSFLQLIFLCLNFPIQPWFNLISALRIWIICAPLFFLLMLCFPGTSLSDNRPLVNSMSTASEKEQNKKRRHHHKVQHRVMGEVASFFF